MVAIISKNYIGEIRYQLLENWSVQYLKGAVFSYNQKFPLVSISSFLVQNKSIINIEDDTVYKRVTIRMNNNGVTERDTELGKNIGTKKQFLAKSGDFVMSKIDARNGAFGILPSGLEGAILTNDFPSFTVDTKQINTQFLVLLINTKQFLRFAQTSSSGTTGRQRIDMDLFLKTKIPLPPLTEQNKIVAAYNSKFQAAETAEKKAIELEISIEQYLNFELIRTTNNATVTNNTLITIKMFSHLSRWDTDFLLQGSSEMISNFAIISFRDIFISIKNGIAARNYADNGTRYLRVSDIKQNFITEGLNLYVNKIKKTDLLQTNDFLITRKGTVGNSCFIKTHIEAVASSEVFIIKIDQTKINGDYLSLINLSNIVKEQYKKKTTGTIMPSLSQEKLKSIEIPLPPLKIQEKIVAYVSALKQKIAMLKNEAQELRKIALTDFEKEVFSS